MTGASALANACWLASGYSANRRFCRALKTPGETQEAWLRAQLARHARSRYGEAHEFASIHDGTAFSRRVPLVDYETLAPWIERVGRGEPQVLGTDAVTHLAPTSGSTGASRLIPFTRGLTAAFDAAVSPWMTDLARQRPRLVGGPVYWSVSPLGDTTRPADADDLARAVPVGFADDAEYLGGPKAWLVRQLLAVPSSVRHVRDERDFWSLSLLALLRQRELRLISVWHPTFLELLVAAAEGAWPDLLDAVERGACPWAGALPASARGAWRARPDSARAAELRRIGPSDWPRWWPHLQVVSCWGEQAAASGWRRIATHLAARLPGVLVQAKGLLATEAIVTVPIGEARPLAITSHYFEFLDESGDIRRAHELVRGKRYEVIVTNGGGLWRYRLGDIVECTGHLVATPSLRFLGRAGQVSDLRGEKLCEPFVAEALRLLWGVHAPPAVATLRGWEDGASAGYELLLSTETLCEAVTEVARRMEGALRENPHYALARRLGQLAPLRVVIVEPDAARGELRQRTGRLGDAKPRTLVGAHESARG